MCHETCPYPVSGGAPVEEQTVQMPLDGAELPAFVVFPDTRPAPGVLLIHDINGPNDFYRDVARRLAGEGYAVALPDLFFRLDPPKDSSREAVRARAAELRQSETLNDVRTALWWLRDHEATTGRLGTVGFCMGGTLVMLAASREPALDASVAFYGFPMRERTPMSPILPSDEDEVANVQSPLLGLWGDQDSGVGMDNVQAYDAELTRLHKAHDFIVYPGVGHGFLTFDPNSSAFEASSNAWQRAVGFLSAHLSQVPTRS